MSQFTELLFDLETRLLAASSVAGNAAMEMAHDPEIGRDLDRGINDALTSCRSLMEQYGEEPWSL